MSVTSISDDQNNAVAIFHQRQQQRRPEVSPCVRIYALYPAVFPRASLRRSRLTALQARTLGSRGPHVCVGEDPVSSERAIRQQANRNTLAERACNRKPSTFDSPGGWVRSNKGRAWGRSGRRRDGSACCASCLRVQGRAV